MARRKKQVEDPPVKPKEEKKPSLFNDDSSFTGAGQRLFDRTRQAIGKVTADYVGKYPIHEIEAVVYSGKLKPVVSAIIVKDSKQF